MAKAFNKGSYTNYSNKIGLYSKLKGSFIGNSRDVVLNFPYKDCVLVGGMTKEDAKRDEKFLNGDALLTNNDIKDIDVLLDPKVFTNFKYVSGGGERSLSASDDIEFFDEDGELKQNLLIKGNNLIALYSLYPRLAGKVKLIYIDPPYNTGNDGFKYNDSFNHSAWLTFMKNRLEIARQLLRDDGLIFVSIDTHEQAYLHILMDEIFDHQFINEFIWISNSKGRQIQANGAAGTHEYLLCYAKDSSSVGAFSGNAEALKQIMPDMYKGFDYSLKNDKYGSYVTTNELYNSNSVFNEETRPNLVYDIFYRQEDGDIITEACDSGAEHDGYVLIRPHKNNDGVHKYHAYRWSREKVKNESYNLEFVPDGNGSFKVFTKRRDSSSTILKDVISNISTSKGLDELNKLGAGVDGFSYPKPEELMQIIVSIATNPGDLVLDYHLGSGTTAAVAHKMGRRWIGIEQMDYIETIAKKRLEKVIAGEQGGISKSVGWQGGGDFVYMELKKYNQDYVDRIWAAQTYGELDAIKDEMLQNAFLKFWFTKADFDAKWRDGEINARKVELINLLDANQLYLNYADMDDDKYKVSDDDKALTKRFYGPDEDGEEISADVDIDDIIDDGDGMETSGE